MRDLIKELKENKVAFGLMDKELQDKAKELKDHMLYYDDSCNFVPQAVQDVWMKVGTTTHSASSPTIPKSGLSIL